MMFGSFDEAIKVLEDFREEMEMYSPTSRDPGKLGVYKALDLCVTRLHKAKAEAMAEHAEAYKAEAAALDEAQTDLEEWLDAQGGREAEIEEHEGGRK